MALHDMALDLPLSTKHHMKYSIPDCGTLEMFHTRIEYET